MNHSHRGGNPATPLASTEIEITICDLLAEYEMRHRFQNDGTDAIDAIYSFPVPLDAAFLGMEATLGDETLVSRVIPAKSATREYDNAIADGDSAVLIEQTEPGMLCVCLGALQAGERGEIVLRFAAALGVAGRVARFSLPLVHRPRYGRSCLLDNGAYPINDFAAEHPLNARIRIRGLLAERPVQCATHGAQFQRDAGETVLKLDKAMLDRDLVLSFDLGETLVSNLRRIRDGDRSIGMLNFVAPQSTSPNTTPRDICLLLDGSGSMQGDAIEQSRAALRVLANELGDDDRIQIIRFGNDTVPLFRRPLRASTRVRAALVELTDTINADLGGTEMMFALNQAMNTLIALDGPAQQKIVILVTDGAVHAHTLESVKRDAANVGIRIFVVAVGSSAGVDVLAPLTTATGATLERAVPAEPIDAAVLRQLRRAREPGPLELHVDWGSSATSLPLGVTYPDDAVTALAFLFDDAPHTVEVRLPHSKQKFELDAAPEVAQAWRIWAGQQAWHHASGPAREAFALHYSLITPETSAVLVKVRANDHKTNGLPRIAPVAHMTPAGTAAASAHLGSQARPLISYVDTTSSIYGDTYATARYSMCTVDDIDSEADLSDASEPRGALPPLSDERIRLITQELLRALFKLFFVEERSDIDTDTLLAEVDSELRGDALRWLDEREMTISGAANAITLFDELATWPSSEIPELTDDQEARLAVLRHPAS